MKRFSRILKYLRNQKKNIALYIAFNLLAVVFSLLSLAMLAPFLQLLFGLEELKKVKPVFTMSATGLLEYLKYYISRLIVTHNAEYALGAICILVVVSIFFKNMFT